MIYYFSIKKFSIHIMLFNKAMERDAFIYFMFSFCNIFHYQVFKTRYEPKKLSWDLSLYWNKKAYLKGNT